MRRTLVRGLVALTGLILVAGVGILGYLRLHERAYIYQPADRHVAPPPAALTLHEQRVTYTSTDGVRLSGWIVPAAEADTAPWMLICHGNYGNIGFGQRPEFYAFMRDLGINLLAFDYRGYGESTGSPSEAGLYADAAASYDYLTRGRGIAPSRVVLFGHSLGTGVAIELASRVPAAALIVDGAYTSVVDRAQEIYWYLPVWLIASERFPSIDRIAKITTPKLFLHSPEDAVIPLAHGRRLFDAAPPPKRFVEIKGGHENAYSIDKAVYYGAIADFLRSLR